MMLGHRIDMPMQIHAKRRVWLAGLLCVAALFLPREAIADKSTDRFALVLNGAAVKDNLTGLIWEQEPDREHDVWSRSNERCVAKEVGGQKGWRGPSLLEHQIGNLLDKHARFQGRHRGLASQLLQRRAGDRSKIRNAPDVVRVE
jgi:hypothetical protein